MSIELREQDWRQRLIEEHTRFPAPPPPRTVGDEVGLGLRALVLVFVGWLLWSVWPEAPLYLAAVLLLAWVVGRAITWLRSQA